MKDHRQGNDLAVLWSILKNGEPFDLRGRSLKLYLKNLHERKEVEDFSIKGNEIHWTFYGKDQNTLGKHTLTLVVNEDEKGMITTDTCDFVRLISCSCKIQNSEDAPNVETESIELTSTLEYVSAGGGSVSILIDEELSLTSTNPVENRVITAALEGKAGKDELPKKLSELENDLEFESYDDSELREAIRVDAQNLADFEDRTNHIFDRLSNEVSEKALATEFESFARYAEGTYAKKEDVKPYDDTEIRDAISLRNVGAADADASVEEPEIGGGGSSNCVDEERLRMIAGASPYLVWEDIYGKVHFETTQLTNRRGQNDSTFRTTCKKIISATFDTSTEEWAFFFGVQGSAESDMGSVEEIYPYAFSTAKLTHLNFAFSNMPNIKNWDFIKHLDVSKVTYFAGVFNNADAEEIDVSNWDLSSAKTLGGSYSFWGKIRKIIGLDKWNVSNVTAMPTLFGAYPLFTDVSGIVNWDVSNCENFSDLFLRHDTIEYIDLSKWRIKDGAAMATCFGVCSRLNTLGLSNIPTGANTTNMFSNCSVLQNIFMREDALIFPTLNFSFCPLSAESVKVILSHLATTPDDGATITFKTGLYSGFSNEEKAEIDALRDSATANGWSIVNMG